MKFFYILMAVVFLAGQAMAQAANGAAPKADRQAQHEQRRAELRSALQTPPSSGEVREAGKHLSDQERAELRRQLRQQRQHPGNDRQQRP